MHLLEDIRAYKKNDPAARSAIEVMLLYNGLHATIDYRIAHWFYLRRCFFIARAISQWSKMWTGIEIHPGATIGRRLVIDHGTGIVIGETARRSSPPRQPPQRPPETASPRFRLSRGRTPP